MGKLAKNVLAGLAVVAVVATVTAAVVLTGGTAIPAVAGALASVGITAAAVAKATFVGGMTVGAMGVAGKAVSDITNDEVSDMDLISK